MVITPDFESGTRGSNPRKSTRVLSFFQNFHSRVSFLFGLLYPRVLYIFGGSSMIVSALSFLVFSPVSAYVQTITQRLDHGLNWTEWLDHGPNWAEWLDHGPKRQKS